MQEEDELRLDALIDHEREDMVLEEPLDPEQEDRERLENIREQRSTACSALINLAVSLLARLLIRTGFPQL